MDIDVIVGYYILAINLLGWLLFGIDKLKAKCGWWRIPERVLICVAILGGSAGAYCGMWIFRHKTQHRKFTWGIPLIFLCQVLLTLYFILNNV
jgi:uncharacterized membrane protein YsdA (DUF1294 family)